MTAGGASIRDLETSFWTRQRVTVRCAHCAETLTTLCAVATVHPADATVWFTHHRARAHPDAPTPKSPRRNRGPRKSGYHNRREHATADELAWRETMRKTRGQA